MGKMDPISKAYLLGGFTMAFLILIQEYWYHKGKRDGIQWCADELNKSAEELKKTRETEETQD